MADENKDPLYQNLDHELMIIDDDTVSVCTEDEALLYGDHQPDAYDPEEVPVNTPPAEAPPQEEAIDVEGKVEGNKPGKEKATGQKEEDEAGT